jgi:hypothetical protein
MGRPWVEILRRAVALAPLPPSFFVPGVVEVKGLTTDMRAEPSTADAVMRANANAIAMLFFFSD